MLARTFLTADQLCIKEEQHAALVAVLLMMDEGQLTHIPEKSLQTKRMLSRKNLPANGFNMSSWRKPEECGTVCCIGGWAEIVSRNRFFTGENMINQELTPELNNLFCPNVYTHYELITVEQAREALRNYLTTGDASWKEVLGERVMKVERVR